MRTTDTIPKASRPARAGLAVIRGYKLAVSPWMRPACRFVPTCSEYAADAIGKYGLWGGVRRAVARLLKCHPLHAGGVDLVD